MVEDFEEGPIDGLVHSGRRRLRDVLDLDAQRTRLFIHVHHAHARPTRTPSLLLPLAIRSFAQTHLTFLSTSFASCLLLLFTLFILSLNTQRQHTMRCWAQLVRGQGTGASRKPIDSIGSGRCCPPGDRPINAETLKIILHFLAGLQNCCGKVSVQKQYFLYERKRFRAVSEHLILPIHLIP